MRYIHEHKDWWRFRYDADKLIRLLAEVRGELGRLAGRLSAMGFAVQSNTALTSISLDVVSSSEIEGITLPADSVRSSVARRLGLDISGMVTPSRYIEGIVDMMMDATQRCVEPLTDERLFGWHSVLFPNGYSGIYKIDVARYRTGEMQVVTGAMGHERVHYEAPAPERVGEEMWRFIHWVNEDEDADPVLKAAIAYLWFVTIHPFDDGNGRIGRAITDMLMARADKSSLRFYSMSNEIYLHRKEYYDVLEKVQHGDGEITEWLTWFLLRLKGALSSTGETLARVVCKAQFWDAHSEVELNARQQKILNLLLDGFEGNMNTGRWSRICRCSRDTALKDATDLIRKGLLRKSEAGGRSTSYELVAPIHPDL